jgi:hypothetical protein
VILDGPFVYTPQVPEEAVLKIEYCEWHQGPAAQAAPAPSIEGLTCIRCGNGDSIRPKATLDRTRPEGAYVTQILPGALSAAAGQRPRYKLERVAGDCAVGSITVTEDEARDVLGWLGEYLGPTAITREQVREAVKQGLTHWHPRLEKTTDAIMKLLEAR